jgi:hypothetical protein
VNTDQWITAKEAAALFGLSVDYFRREFLNPGRPLFPIRLIRGTGRGHRILVSREAVLAAVEGQIVRPAP